jgi:DNA mismatch repair protein MutL
MPKIRVLDWDTVNKIAAGEVVERPASVVKELVENSIDAGATKILIEVDEGGKRLVRVTDDGCGMDSDDIRLAFQKHSTSKIATAEDLERVATLGFRGEALSSIASVAREVEVRSKPRSLDPAVSGTYLRIDAGRVVEVRETGCPLGTAIAVKDLFYNVPARLKYLKSGSAELARITKTVTDLAIINHSISFELFSGKKTILKTTRRERWDEAILSLFGREVVKELIPLEVLAKRWTIRGLVSTHRLTRASPDGIFIYVNRRLVLAKGIQRALRDGYGNLIPHGRHPFALISIEIDPRLIDVNVHPTKREIRFLKEEEMATSLTKAIGDLVHAEVTKTSGLKAVSEPGSRAVSIEKDSQRPLPFVVDSREEAKLEIAASDSSFDEKQPIRILGQVLDLYIVGESERGLILIDQHAAAERVRYESLLCRHSREGLRQELLDPMTLDLTPKEQVLLDSWMELLADIGFEIHHFGGCTYNVRAVPAIGSLIESPGAVHEVLMELFSSGKVRPLSDDVDEALKLLACRGSVKAGEKLERAEMYGLIEALYRCDNPWTCPHGRPTVVTVSKEQLEKIFGRR